MITLSIETIAFVLDAITLPIELPPLSADPLPFPVGVVIVTVVRVVSATVPIRRWWRVIGVSEISACR